MLLLISATSVAKAQVVASATRLLSPSEVSSFLWTDPGKLRFGDEFRGKNVAIDCLGSPMNLTKRSWQIRLALYNGQAIVDGPQLLFCGTERIMTPDSFWQPA